LAVVVLPQPDSPIRPSVSAPAMLKLMPSTAFTQAVLRASKAPLPTGKYLRILSTSSSGAVMKHLCCQPASRRPIRAACNIIGFLRGTARNRIAGARMKSAAGRRPRQVGRLAGNGIERLLAAELGHGAEQCTCVGVLRPTEKLAHGAHLHNAAGVHYRH